LALSHWLRQAALVYGISPWEHTFWGVLEADSVESITQFMDPLPVQAFEGFL
jgi:hypothetical protein